MYLTILLLYQLPSLPEFVDSMGKLAMEFPRLMVLGTSACLLWDRV